MLVPNREIQQRRAAERLATVDDGGVCLEPAVLMLSAWVEDAAVRIRQLRGLDVPVSLDSVTAAMIWAQAAGRDEAPLGRVFSRADALQARAADRLLRQWFDDRDPPWLHEAYFARRERARRLQEAGGLFSAEDWLADLSGLVSDPGEKSPLLPAEIVLDGFVEFTALERRLFSALEARGVRIQASPSGERAGDLEVVACATPEDEWQSAAAWAKRRLAAGARSLCVVLPSALTEAGADARRIRQVFSAVFHPRQAVALDTPKLRDFHIPAAGRLSHSSLASDALLLCRLYAAGRDEPHDFPRISRWLLSPNWKAADGEASARARLELQLRRRGQFRLTLAEVLRLASTDGHSGRLAELVACLRALPGAVRVEDAGTWLSDALRFWGWPGAAVGHVAQLHVAALASRLERLQGCPAGSADEALSMLESSCAEATIPFGGGPLSPVQVLPPEVAAAGHFDGIWVCGLDDANWPPPVVVNPCLPAAARAAVPRMNPEGQLAYFRTLTGMLCAAAPQVRLSWSADGGEGPRGRSGLIAEAGRAEPASQAPVLLSRVARPQADTPACAALEAIEDQRGIPYPETGQVELPGGADFFHLQAACPLAAYLRHRVGARFPDAPRALASPQFRGDLLHQALRELYLRGRGATRMPGDEDIGPAVELALQRLDAGRRLTGIGMRAEQGRLLRVLREWLAFDRQRCGFEVESLEEPLHLALGRAVLGVRIDRRDRLADGRLFLIDYKSGKGGRSRALKWGRPRIQEPQLPLYATLLEAGTGVEAGGLAFAIVRPGECGFDGIGDDADSAGPGVRLIGRTRSTLAFDDWGALRAHWREQVAGLLEEILAGRADNRVYDADALVFSDLGLILRRAEGDAASDLEDLADAG